MAFSIFVLPENVNSDFLKFLGFSMNGLRRGILNNANKGLKFNLRINELQSNFWIVLQIDFLTRCFRCTPKFQLLIRISKLTRCSTFSPLSSHQTEAAFFLKNGLQPRPLYEKEISLQVCWLNATGRAP